MKAFTPLVAAALITASSAATVKIDTTQCNPTAGIENFEVTVDTLLVREFKSACGFKVASANGVEVNGVQCEAFKDKEGKTSGSAKFTQTSPVIIASAVQINSIKCTAPNSTTPGNATAPSNSTSSIKTSTGNSTATGAPPASTGNAGQGNGNGANGTAPSGGPNQPPQPSQPPPPGKPNGAERTGMSFGVAGAVLVGMAMLGL
ncbi:hypothetical protein DM02DRAFT_648275 [Periconia macrospinosa]|uniref:Uncharacterized protein n=1 Tax=Periconia macrospinosa TaxID=97972 RepID=A0A2V1ECE3_9PLEO|nr:hypothetical protein DM02DRAFT_648275 [Periconia macrospinosa]